GNGTKTMKGRRKMRSQKRAWRWRMPKEEPIEDGYAKCRYVSRRIGIACDNIRHRSELSSMGLCERHTQFAQQLKAIFIAEQSLSDQGDFIAHRIDEDGILAISDDDETLSATFDWRCSEESLHYDPTATGDYSSILANTEVITEKELLMCRLAALESRMAAIKEYREVLAEKQRRYEAYLTKEILEETKKGQLVAETRKEKRQMRILRANKRYGHWRNWKASKLMRQQLEARLRMIHPDSTADIGCETRLDYLDVELENEEPKPICAFIYTDENGNNREDECETKSREDNSNGNETDGCREMKRRQCENVALPGVNYCLHHIFENCNQQMFAACLECGAAALDLDDGNYYCSTHISMKNADRKKLYGPLEVKTSFDFSAASTPPSSIRASLDSASNLAQPSESAEPVLGESLPADKEGNCASEDLSEAQIAAASTEFNGLALLLNNLELKGSDVRVQYDEEDPNAPPVRIILIDDEEDTVQSKTTQQSKEECAIVNVVQRRSSTPADPSFGVDSLGIVATRRGLITPRRKVDDGSTSSAARTRPFIPAFFPHGDSISKHQRKPSNPLTNTVISPQRYITIEQRTHTEEGVGPSQMTIQKLRTSGPYLPSDIQKHGQRIASTSSKSNLMFSNSITAPTSTRSMSMPSGGYHVSTSISSRLTDPSAISLSSSPITQLSQPLSQPKRSAVVQRNTAAIIRSRQVLPSQSFRQSATTSAIERPSYAMAGTSPALQRWRPQRTSAITASGGMQNPYRYSKIDANDRCALRMQPQRDYEEYYYRPREMKAFSVSGSARSRLVPVDPSPAMYYVRPQYQAYTPISLSRPMRRYQQEGESIRRISLPCEMDRQQLQETAAAVASIASLNEVQSEQHQEDEEATESTLRQSNVLVAPPEVSSEEQGTEQASSKGMLTGSEVAAASNPYNEPQQDEDSAAQRMQASCPSQESDSVVEGNTNTGAVSQKYCNCIENAEDGLAVLAMAAASHAAAIDHHQNASSGEPLKADEISNSSLCTLPLSSEMCTAEPVREPVKSVESSIAPLESNDTSSLDAPQAKRSRITSFGLEVEDEEY
uniref:Potential DNA-binding domain-containing protein n=1 Tax=Parascaris univalens TaxID=6257 RepID=A0A915CIU7_PARUN